MAVHAALSVLLSRLAGTRDVAIGTPVAGRGEQALDDLVGMFVNTLVLRTDVEPSARFMPSRDISARRLSSSARTATNIPSSRALSRASPPSSSCGVEKTRP